MGGGGGGGGAEKCERSGEIYRQAAGEKRREEGDRGTERERAREREREMGEKGGGGIQIYRKAHREKERDVEKESCRNI